MAKVHVSNIEVMDNPSPFHNPFQFEISFECMEALEEDLEWRIIYVGSAESEQHDQILDNIFVGPIPEGRHKFLFQAPPPKVEKIPVNDVLGCTVVLLTCLYRDQEFLRVGYYTNNEYSDPELKENPPAQPVFDKIERNILASQPRVTRFNINWGDGEDMPVASAAGEVGEDSMQIGSQESEWTMEGQNSLPAPAAAQAQG